MRINNNLLMRLLVTGVTVLAAASGIASTAQVEIAPRNVQFNHLTAADGLSHAIVTDVVQDRRGYIWIGTQEGLNRFDGYQIKTYEHYRLDDRSLSHDFVRSLMVDATGALWVGTEDGLNRYDAATDSFDRTPLPGEVLRESIKAVLETRDGVLWIGTNGAGLFMVDRKSDRVVRFTDGPDEPGRLQDNSIISLMEDSKGNLWVGTRSRGLFRFDEVNSRFVQQGSLDPADPGYLGSEIRKIYEDRSGYVWIGSGNAGVSRFDPRPGTFERFQADVTPGSLPSNKVRDIVEDLDGTIWLATDAGLAERREKRNAFVTYRHATGSSHSLVGDRLNSLFVDRSGVLWVGSWEGLSRWNYFSDTFSYYGSTEGLLPGDIVTSISETSSGVLWIGTYGDGLVRLDPVTHEQTTYNHDKAEAGSLPGNRVMAVHVDPADRVWVGTRSNGLAMLDAESNQFVRYRHDPENQRSLSGNAVSSIHTDPDGVLWVGTFGDGLNRFDGEGFEVMRHDPADPESLSGDRVISIATDRHGMLWIGTEGSGVNRMLATDGSFQQFRRFRIAGREETEFMLDTVTDIVHDHKGDYWLGTLGNGLLRVSHFGSGEAAVNTRLYGKAQGLPTNTIYGVVQGQDKELWLSSNRGLIRLDTETGSVRQFDSQNGLREDEFNAGARLRSISGKLMFGSTLGVVGFHPGELPVNAHAPTVVYTARSREKMLTTGSSVEAAAAAELGYADRNLTVDFVALDFVSPDKHQYEYILEGFDPNWIAADDVRRAVYTNLPSGEYTFRVRAANNDGVWNFDGASLQVRVFPAPWLTWWAYLIYALLGLAMIGLYLRWQQLRLRSANEQRDQLEQEVEKRTSELEQRNRELETLNEKLAEASVTDSLTGLRNRRYVDQFMNADISLFERSQTAVFEDDLETNGEAAEQGPPGQRTMFFMMIDLDGFKLINDRYGHHAGDMALVQIKNVLEDCTRGSDTLIRWGGDEFMVIGFSSEFFGVKVLAERIRVAIANRRYSVGVGAFGRLSASIGIAAYPLIEDREHNCSWELVAKVADHAAYMAKASGRNAWVSLSGVEALDGGDSETLSLRLEELVESGAMTLDSSLETKFEFPPHENPVVRIMG